MTVALIVDAVRIPRTRVRKNGGGRLAGVKPIQLLKPLFQALARRNPLPVAQVDDILLGCVTQIGEQGADIARIAALYAGWHDAVPGLTLNRFCCSGLDAVNLGAAKIAGGEHLVVAGGVESLSRVPMFADKGAWYADPEVAEATGFIHMGVAADLLAAQRGYTRRQLDEVALRSHQRAATAQAQGRFQGSLIPVTEGSGNILAVADDAVRPETTLEALAQLKPAFPHPPENLRTIARTYPELGPMEPLHTPGNAPAIVDGASLLLLASPDKAAELGLQPKARLSAYANRGSDPVLMLTGHIHATQKLFKAKGLTPQDIDLWEINESFAASVLAYRDTFGIADDRLNVNGSAIAMGHPLGATGGILVGTLLDELTRRDLKRGIVAIPGGAGVGTATLIERH